MEEGDIDEGMDEMIQYYNTRAGSNDGSAKRAACEVSLEWLLVGAMGGEWPIARPIAKV